MSRKILLTLNDVENMGLEQLSINEGFTKNEILRIGIRLFTERKLGKKKHPQKKSSSESEYVTAIESFQLAPEAYCVNILKGEVTELDGVSVCKYESGGATITEPLSTLNTT